MKIKTAELYTNYLCCVSAVNKMATDMSPAIRVTWVHTEIIAAVFMSDKNDFTDIVMNGMNS